MLANQLCGVIISQRVQGRSGIVLFRRIALVFFAWWTVALLQPPVAASAQVQEGAVNVEVIPSSVDLPPKGDAQVLAVVTNGTSEPMRNVRLSTFSNAGVKATLQENAEEEVQELAPEGEHTWPLEITRTRTGPTAGTVQLRVDYNLVKENGTRVIPQTVFGTLETKSRVPTTVDEVAEAQVRTTLGALSQQRPGSVYLTVRNKSDVPLRLQGFSLTVPANNVTFDCQETEFIAANCAIKGGEVTITPNKNRTIALNLNAKDKVTPGKYLLLFELPVKWGWPGANQGGVLVASQEISVEVFGESQILTLLGVPLLLALPGFLVVGTWAILWAVYPLKPKDEMPAFPVSFNTPGFWIVALTISGIVVFGYSIATRNSYLQTYGLSDIVVLWLISVIVLGCVGYLLIKEIAHQYRLWSVPLERDDPVRILWKLKGRDLGIKLDRVRVEANGKLYKLFVLEPKLEDQKKISVGPYMVVKWRKVDSNQLEQQEDIREKVKHLIRQDDPGGLAKLLEQGRTKGVLDVKWDRSMGLGGPLRVSKEDVKDWSVEPDIVVVTD
jgi:hypothetical protein